MDRMTKEQIEAWRKTWSSTYRGNEIYDGALKQLNAICDLAIRSLSLESVREEALEEAAREIEPASGLSEDGTLLIRKGQAAIRALKERHSPARVAEGRAESPAKEQPGEHNLGQGWIPVSERLPKQDGTPLYLLHRNGTQWTGCMQTDHPGFEDTYKAFRYFTDEAEREIWEHGDITHWRLQLPPPPERP